MKTKDVCKKISNKHKNKGQTKENKGFNRSTVEIK